ncbi:esterase-like activity of phytase family protein [Yunchengibacter salinarum]|uniref:esterase-like activity of phytase family protein n=1 Tax=Yunchengibacter salinarum TaxID=3133399 RepID=UPI0035B649DD
MIVFTRLNAAIAVMLLLVGPVYAAGMSRQDSSAPAEGRAMDPVAINLQAEPVPFAEDAKTVDAETGRTGALVYERGWALTSDHEDFGGWSDVRISGGRLTAVGDSGSWLTAAFHPTRQQPFSDVRLIPAAPADAPNRKRRFDMESLVRVPLGWLVGVEQDHTIRFVAAPGGWRWPAPAGQAIDWTGIAPNGGAEAMTMLSGGRLLVFSERGRDVSGALKAWLVQRDRPADPPRAATLGFEPPQNYVPTSAATLPDGDVLVLLRHFSPVDGVSAKLLRLAGDSIKAGARLKGRVLATLAPPMSVDNMEGLALLPPLEKGGPLRVALLSDDNFNAFQRTLLLIYRLDEGGATGGDQGD